MNGWLSAMDLAPEEAPSFQFVVPSEPKTWKDGTVDLDRELGATGLLDEGKLVVVRMESA